MRAEIDHGIAGLDRGAHEVQLVQLVAVCEDWLDHGGVAALGMENQPVERDDGWRVHEAGAGLRGLSFTLPPLDHSRPLLVISSTASFGPQLPDA